MRGRLFSVILIPGSILVLDYLDRVSTRANAGGHEPGSIAASETPFPVITELFVRSPFRCASIEIYFPGVTRGNRAGKNQYRRTKKGDRGMILARAH